MASSGTLGFTAGLSLDLEGSKTKTNEKLSIKVGNDLNIESLRDSISSNSNGFNLSAGFSIGASDSDAGKDSNGNSTVASRTQASQQIGARTGNGEVSSVNASYGANTGRTKVKQTVLSSLTGNKVEIDVDGNTNIKGALIASGKFDKDGNFIDNEKLKLTTKTLSFANNTNTRFSSNSGFNVGANVGLTPNAKDSTPNDNNNTNNPKVNSTNVGFNTDKGYKRSKTLATLGKGDITVKDKENSDELDLLNTNTKNINKNLTDVKAGTSVQASIDHRLFSEDGRKQIKEDFDKAGLLVKAVSDLATKESLSVGGNRSEGETGFTTAVLDNLSLYEGTKKFVNDPKNQKEVQILQNPNATAEDKKQALHALHASVANEMGVEPSEVKMMIASDRKGFTSHENKNVYIADNKHNNMSDIVNTTLNETSDVSDMYRDKDVIKGENYKANRSEYSDSFGDLGEILINKEYSSNGYTTLDKVTNNKIGTNALKPKELSQNVIDNTVEYDGLNKEEGANRDGYYSIHDIRRTKDLQSKDINVKIKALIETGKSKEEIKKIVKNDASYRALVKNGEKAFEEAYNIQKVVVDNTNKRIDWSTKSLRTAELALGGREAVKSVVESLSKKSLEFSIQNGLKAGTVEIGGQILTDTIIKDPKILFEFTKNPEETIQKVYNDLSLDNIDWQRVVISSTIGSNDIGKNTNIDTLKYDYKARTEIKRQVNNQNLTSATRKEKLEDRLQEKTDKLITSGIILSTPIVTKQILNVSPKETVEELVKNNLEESNE